MQGYILHNNVNIYHKYHRESEYDMPTLEQIQEQLKGLDGTSKLFGRKEIKELPSILWEDEKLEKLIQGFYGGGQGILAATNKRLVFVDKGLLYGLRVEDFPYDKITSIQYETGFALGKLIIFASGNKAVIENVEKTQVKVFAEFIRARISIVKEHASYTVPQQNNANDDLIAQLEKLAELKDRGILTEEEFTAKKKQLLGI